MGERFSYAPSHIGICVRDLERSRRFYIDGLGFAEFARFEMTRPIAEVESPCDLTSYFMQKGDLRVELLHYRSPGVIGHPSTRRNQLGLTHLSFVVDDVDAAAHELETFGGTIVEGTRSGQDDPDDVQIIFLADPDGTRVELMRLAKGQPW
ncbi:MAG: VOC family protein [Actinobacteria bacterium]|nr:MAG: VOC family protein [Actinomycetota bacterium]